MLYSPLGKCLAIYHTTTYTAVMVVDTVYMVHAKLTYDELLTVLTEVEAIINSRPLSCVSSEDLDEPLTSSHMLCGCRILSLPDGTVATENNTDEDFKVDTLNKSHILYKVLTLVFPYSNRNLYRNKMI